MTTDAARASGLLHALLGAYLSQLGVGAGELQMCFSGGPVLQLEAEALVGVGARVEPYSLEGLAHLLPLLNCDVSGAEVDATGTLTLTFGDASGAKVMALPGGDLAIWSNR